jgi:hypothetical protein
MYGVVSRSMRRGARGELSGARLYAALLQSSARDDRFEEVFWYGTEDTGVHVTVTIVDCSQAIEELSIMVEHPLLYDQRFHPE